MHLYPSLFSSDDLFGYNRPSIYVISDAEMVAYKQQQREREIIALEELIEGHKTSITHLEKTIALLKDDDTNSSK